MNKLYVDWWNIAPDEKIPFVINESDETIYPKDLSNALGKYNCIPRLKNQINDLKKENEQLKKQIHQLQHWNKCLAEKRHNELKGDVE